MDKVYDKGKITVQEDKKALLKEYAGSGYRLLHNYQEMGFEELWSEAFKTVKVNPLVWQLQNIF